MLEKIDLSKTADKETYKAVRDQLGAKLGLLRGSAKQQEFRLLLCLKEWEQQERGFRLTG